MDCPYSDSYNQWRWDFWLLHLSRHWNLLNNHHPASFFFYVPLLLIFFKTPWIFPIILIVGGAAGIFSMNKMRSRLNGSNVPLNGSRSYCFPSFLYLPHLFLKLRERMTGLTALPSTYLKTCTVLEVLFLAVPTYWFLWCMNNTLCVLKQNASNRTTKMSLKSIAKISWQAQVWYVPYRVQLFRYLLISAACRFKTKGGTGNWQGLLLQALEFFCPVFIVYILLSHVGKSP